MGSDLECYKYTMTHAIVFVSLSLCLKEQYQSFASDSYNLKECTEVDVELLNLKCGKIV